MDYRFLRLDLSHDLPSPLTYSNFGLSGFCGLVHFTLPLAPHSDLVDLLDKFPVKTPRHHRHNPLASLVLLLDRFSSGVLWRFGDSPSLHKTPSLKRSREKTTGRSTERRQDANSNYQSFTLLLRASSG